MLVVLTLSPSIPLLFQEHPFMYGLAALACFLLALLAAEIQVRVDWWFYQRNRKKQLGRDYGRESYAPSNCKG